MPIKGGDVVSELGGHILNRRNMLTHSLAGGLVMAGAGLVLPRQAEAAAVDAGLQRVVVTGNNAQGKSYIVKDEMMKRGPIWSNTAQEMMGPGGASDIKNILASTAPNIDPPAGGARWQFYAMQPSARKKGDPIDRTLGKDGFHRTVTIDYDFIFSGEVTMYLDIGEVDLKTGDMVIQRNTSHAWHNYGTTPCILLAMLIHV